MPFPANACSQGDSNGIAEIHSQKPEKEGEERAYKPKPPSCFKRFWGSSNNLKTGDFHPFAG